MFSYTFPASAAVWGCVAFLLSHQSRATFIEPAVDTNLSQAVKFVFQCFPNPALPSGTSMITIVTQVEPCSVRITAGFSVSAAWLYTGPAGWHHSWLETFTGSCSKINWSNYTTSYNGKWRRGDGNGRAGWRRAARPAAPTLSAPVQSTASSAASHGNYHFTWLEPCSRDASGCARIL